MDGLTLEVLSFDGQILKEKSIEMVTIETIMGPINILKDHAPLMTALDIGVLSYIKKGQEDSFVALGMNGFAEIYDNHISVIVNTAEKQEDIDVVRARRAKEKLEEDIRSGRADLKAEIALKRAVTRISCKEGICRL